MGSNREYFKDLFTGVGKKTISFIPDQVIALHDVIARHGDLRDLVFFYLILNSGARLSEVLNLRRKDILNEDGYVLEECNHRLLKKRKKNRKIKINYREFSISSQIALKSIEKYCRLMVQKGFKSPNSLIFPGKKTNGRLKQSYHRSLFSKRFKRYYELAGFEAPEGYIYGFHSFRKHYVDRLLEKLPDNVGPLVQARFIQQQMKWEKLETVLSYICSVIVTNVNIQDLLSQYDDIFQHNGEKANLGTNELQIPKKTPFLDKKLEKVGKISPHFPTFFENRRSEIF